MSCRGHALDNFTFVILAFLAGALEPEFQQLQLASSGWEVRFGKVMLCGQARAVIVSTTWYSFLFVIHLLGVRS